MVEAVFSQLSVMSAAGLRELAGLLPHPGGNAGNLPSILASMPHHGYSRNTEKYAEGPLALEAIGSPLSADLVDFSASPEVVLGQYSTSGGGATLMLIEYPTPALAADICAGLTPRIIFPCPRPVWMLSKTLSVFAKRTGPILAIAGTDFPE